jgi:ribosomal protein S20
MHGDSRSVERRQERNDQGSQLEKVSGSDRTVSQKAHIKSPDLKSDLLDEVAQMLRSEQAATNKQLLQYRGTMLDSSRRQYTNTVKECVNGIDLIKSLKDAQKTSDLSSKERYENAILESKNKTLARLFEQAVVSERAKKESAEIAEKQKRQLKEIWNYAEPLLTKKLQSQLEAGQYLRGHAEITSQSVFHRSFANLGKLFLHIP